jgi:hypothetical protein
MATSSTIVCRDVAAARKLMAEAVGIDSHIGMIQRVVMGDDLGKRHDAGHVDLPRLREGEMHAAFFAPWVPVFFRGAEAVRRTLDLRDAMQSVLDEHADQIELAATASDIEQIVKAHIALTCFAEQKNTVVDLEETVRVYTLRYKGGTTTSLEVLDEQRPLYGAELTLAAARGDEYRSLVQLYRALGGGWQH